MRLKVMQKLLPFVERTDALEGCTLVILGEVQAFLPVLLWCAAVGALTQTGQVTHIGKTA